jgi:hypothetical protein
MDAVLFSYFLLITGLLIPVFILVAVRPPQPSGVKPAREPKGDGK